MIATSATLFNETMCFDGKSLGQTIIEFTRGVDLQKKKERKS